jgi:hypothetical protein
MSPKKILSLGKFIDDAYEQYIKKGGRKNKKTFLKEDIDKKKIDDKKPKFTKKDYEKSLVDKFGKGTSLVSLNKNVKNIAEKSLKDKGKIKPKLDNKKTFTKKEYEKNLIDNLKKPNQKTKTTTVTNKTKTTAGAGASAGKQTSKNILNKQKQSFLKRNKGKIAGGAGVLSTVPFLIDTKDSKVGAKENKKVTPSKNTGPDTSKITKPTTAKVKKQTLPKTKSNDYTGRFIDKEGNVAYDSFSDFLAHMTGKPKKRAMPKKTARIIGTGNKLKRKEADTKGAGKGVKFKAFSGGGLIAGLYDKPEKSQKYKGNISSARQVKGFGKARKG